MTQHLCEDECVAAADGSLVAERTSHLDTCSACRQAVEHARILLASVAALDVPEPSPLFWDDLLRDVRRATVAPAPAEGARGWAAWFSLVATAATVVLAVWVVRQPEVGFRGGETQAVDAVVEPGEFDLLSAVAITGAWTDEELGDVADAALVSVDELSADERAVFVALVGAELEVVQ